MKCRTKGCKMWYTRCKSCNEARYCKVCGRCDNCNGTHKVTVALAQSKPTHKVLYQCTHVLNIIQLYIDMGNDLNAVAGRRLESTFMTQKVVGHMSLDQRAKLVLLPYMQINVSQKAKDFYARWVIEGRKL